jgi:hypothetical protein
VPPRLRRVLHRAIDFLADSRDAERQARRRALRAARRRSAVPDFRPTGAARVLLGIAAVRRDVGVSRDDALAWLAHLEIATQPSPDAGAGR